MAGSDHLRVAVTLEQCWHRIPGGTATSTLRSVAALEARGDVSVIGVGAWHRRPPEPPWVPPVEVASLPLPRLALYQAWHRLRWPPVGRASGFVDVVHATTFAIPPRTAPLVVTVHDLAFLRHPDFFTPRGLRLFRRGLELIRRDADVVVCPSRATAEDCLEAGIGPDRLVVVPWGVEVEPATEADVARVRTVHGLPRPYILWVGTIEPRKNLPRLLAAFDHLGRRDLDLVLVGPSGWHEDLGVDGPGDGVRLLGFVPEADLGALYAGAEVFCYPSLLEGFGMPVLEAMAQGTPVVTSRGTATAEVAADGALTVDPLDVGAIAGALAAILGDDALRGRLESEARRRAGAATWARTADGLAAVYRGVVR